MDNGNTQNFELDQLNLDTSSEDWGNNTPGTTDDNHSSSAPERNQRAIGSTAITAPGSDLNLPHEPESTPDLTPQSSTNPKLGEITPVMPPGYQAPEPSGAPQSETPPLSFKADHAMLGDRLSPHIIDALQDRERELLANGDIASFVDFVDDAREQFQGKEAA